MNQDKLNTLETLGRRITDRWRKSLLQAPDNVWWHAQSLGGWNGVASVYVPVDLPNSYRALSEAEVGHEWICRRLGEPEVILLQLYHSRSPQSQALKTFYYSYCIWCRCMCERHTRATVQMWKSEDSVVESSPASCVDSSDWTQVIRLGGTMPLATEPSCRPSNSLLKCNLVKLEIFIWERGLFSGFSNVPESIGKYIYSLLLLLLLLFVILSM